MKTLLQVQRSDRPHWVGDGFPVRNAFSYDRNGRELSPFLLLDYAGPTEFAPTAERRGVGEHPHRGFETVTIVYDGEVEHRDSSGGGGVIGPGDVQWMTAGAGLVHEERHGKTLAEKGGAFEMVQLWVNLPAAHKMAPPRYQGIRSGDIPLVDLEGGTARIIAGRLRDTVGPAQTFTALSVWDVRLNPGAKVQLDVPEGHNASVFVLSGEASSLGAATLGIFSAAGSGLTLESKEGAKLLVLTGEPIREPIVGYGPFVMNTPQQIQEALDDYRAGRMGSL